MKALYCQPLRGKTVADIRKKVSKEADIVEIWLDHLEDDLEDLKKIKKPLLFVCKGKREKGKFTGSESDRVQVLIDSLEVADYVDIDIRTDKKLVKKLFSKCKSTKKILSYHNFEKTPQNLAQTYKKMRALKPDIIKFSTFIKDSRNIGELFKLIIRAREDGQSIITLGMGENGKITRILAPKLGNYLYYAPISKSDASAPGQMTYEELNEYWLD